MVSLDDSVLSSNEHGPNITTMSHPRLAGGFPKNYLEDAPIPYGVVYRTDSAGHAQDSAPS